MEQLNYANLLAFIQVGVAFNFGLLYLKKKNVFKDIYDEFLRYVGAVASDCIKQADELMKLVKANMPQDIRTEKAKLNNYEKKLRYLCSHDFRYPYLPCLGLYSGIYGFIALFLIGGLGWCYDRFLMDLIIVFAELVAIMEVIAIYQLYSIKNDKANRYFILVNLAWFVILSGIVLIFVANDWVWRCGIRMEYCILISITVSYIPILVICLTITKQIFKVLHYQRLCIQSNKRLNILLDNYNRTLSQRPKYQRK